MRYLLSVLLFLIVLVAAAALVIFGSGALQIGGVALLALFLLVSLAFDFVAARSNERHALERPDLLRNDVAGKNVRARGDFERVDGVARGVVTYNGEQWRAHSASSRLPEDGEMLTVRGRDGLTLHVQTRDDTAGIQCKE